MTTYASRNAHHKYVADDDVTSYLMMGLWRVTAHMALQCEPKQESTGPIEASSVYGSTIPNIDAR